MNVYQYAIARYAARQEAGLESPKGAEDLQRAVREYRRDEELGARPGAAGGGDRH
jgi:hypothetical protein